MTIAEKRCNRFSDFWCWNSAQLENFQLTEISSLAGMWVWNKSEPQISFPTVHTNRVRPPREKDWGWIQARARRKKFSDLMNEYTRILQRKLNLRKSLTFLVQNSFFVSTFRYAKTPPGWFSAFLTRGIPLDSTGKGTSNVSHPQACSFLSTQFSLA